MGVEINLESNGQSAEAVLFGETPSRIVISFSPENLERVRELVAACPFQIIGKATGKGIQVLIDEANVISSAVGDLECIWKSSLEKKLNQE